MDLGRGDLIFGGGRLCGDRIAGNDALLNASVFELQVELKARV